MNSEVIDSATPTGTGYTDSAAGGSTASKKSKNGIAITAAAIACAACAAGGLFLGSSMAESVNDASQPGGVGMVIDAGAGIFAQAPKTDSQDAEKPGVSIPGWGSFELPAGKTDLPFAVDFFNPEANDGFYYLTFEIRLPDDSPEGYSVLYSSQLVPPGQHIQSITLSKALEAGTYSAIIHVQPYTMDLIPTNNLDMKTVIYAT